MDHDTVTGYIIGGLGTVCALAFGGITSWLLKLDQRQVDMMQKYATKSDLSGAEARSTQLITSSVKQIESRIDRMDSYHRDAFNKLDRSITNISDKLERIMENGKG